MENLDGISLHSLHQVFILIPSGPKLIYSPTIWSGSWEYTAVTTTGGDFVNPALGRGERSRERGGGGEEEEEFSFLLHHQEP